MHFTAGVWERLWRAVNLRGDPHQWFNELSRRYSEQHRRYHNIQHIEECLTEFEQVAGQAKHPIALELAIWFHDAVYDPRRSDNEEQSAVLALNCLEQGASEQKQLVSDLILATKTHLANSIPDAPLLIDIDLSILGKPATRFAEYEAAIRDEYSFVPFPVYAQKRAAILRNFLARPKIFMTPSFVERFESQARTNLSNSIGALENQRGLHPGAE
jgi:predicted metal-dependent HD superfamily phosphohydrolase